MERDEAVHRMAERQYAVVATWQLRPTGVDRATQRRRILAGRWEQAAPRVIRMAGSPRSQEQLVMTAVLDAGRTAVASHFAAGWLWELPGCHATADVLQARHSYAGKGTHRPRLLLPHHRVEVRGIACTSLPRTIFDLAGVLPLGRMARLVDTVVTRSPAMLPALHQMLDEVARSGRGGIADMRLLLDERPVGAIVPASGLERQFEQICRHAGLIGFERQVDVGGHSWIGRVDYHHRDLALVVEVDSDAHHTSLTDRANDMARDDAMLRAGWRKVVRISEHHIWRQPWVVVETLRQAMSELEARAA